MTTHAMIDIETLDTTPSSVILSVGAVRFDPFTGIEPSNKILWRPEIEAQFDQDRTSSEATLEWWSKQAPEIQAVTFTDEGRMPIDQFMKELNKYLVGVDKIWCHGYGFDMTIIEDLFRNNEHHMNWNFWQVMDSRTLFSLLPVDPRKAMQQNLHSADDDAYWQAVGVQQAYTHLGIVPR